MYFYLVNRFCAQYKGIKVVIEPDLRNIPLVKSLDNVFIKCVACSSDAKLQRKLFASSRYVEIGWQPGSSHPANPFKDNFEVAFQVTH